ncbi:hypothetical protein QBC38DRAFT_445327 [Podospora fimiseda]|uniref:Uncharacterized protein n=1 Tax=Podospora fimiseda TaxID=252190 RepID=A0AAN7BLX0_9PEZI|nr:hypothetical protein QBC38DRAFT_445327 [Podospora fimiseda]
MMQFYHLSLLWPVAVIAQNCVSIPGGCDGGYSHNEAVTKAMDKFVLGSNYGGDSAHPIVFAAGVENDTTAFISYSCTDGSTPASVDGLEIRNLVEPLPRSARTILAGPGDGDCCSPSPSDDDVKDLVDILFRDWLDLEQMLRDWLEDLIADRISARLPVIARKLFSLYFNLQRLTGGDTTVNALGPIKRIIPLITALNALDIAQTIIFGGPLNGDTFFDLSDLVTLFETIVELFPPEVPTATVSDSDPVTTPPPIITSTVPTPASTSAPVCRQDSTLDLRSIDDSDDEHEFLQKRGSSGRIYRTGVIGPYGGTGGFVTVCDNNVFSFKSGAYPSTSNTVTTPEQDDDGEDSFMWLKYREIGWISCARLRDDFDSNTGSLYGWGNLASQPMLRLTWYDWRYENNNQIGPLMNIDELFVLESSLNLLKGKIMNGRPLSEPGSLDGMIGKPTSWPRCIKKLDDIAMVMSYLNQVEVTDAWSRPAQRVYDFMAQGAGTNVLPGGEEYARFWQRFIFEWLRKRQEDLTRWVNNVKHECIERRRRYYRENTACSTDDEQADDPSTLWVNNRWPSGRFAFPSAETLHPGWPSL